MDRSKHTQHRFQSSSRSILGLLLFLIYVSDLNVQGAKLILYADDANVLVVDKN